MAAIFTIRQRIDLDCEEEPDIVGGISLEFTYHLYASDSESATRRAENIAESLGTRYGSRGCVRQYPKDWITPGPKVC